MPIYEYICDDCQNEFEKIVINKQQEISCPTVRQQKSHHPAFRLQLRHLRRRPQNPSPRNPAVAEAAAAAVAAATKGCSGGSSDPFVCLCFAEAR